MPCLRAEKTTSKASWGLVLEKPGLLLPLSRSASNCPFFECFMPREQIAAHASSSRMVST